MDVCRWYVSRYLKNNNKILFTYTQTYTPSPLFFFDIISNKIIIGRMQKPVRVIQAYEPLEEPQFANLTSATRAALLLLPETFSDFEFFTMIAGLSYRGDFRMTFGENPKKVKNIVTKNLAHFHELYSPHVLKAVPSLTTIGPDRTRFSQDLDPITRAGLMKQLPSAVRHYLLPRQSRSIPTNETNAAVALNKAASGWEALPQKKTTKMVKLAIHQVVARSSLSQGFKGVFTAGVWKAFTYALSKMNKYRKGLEKAGGLVAK